MPCTAPSALAAEAGNAVCWELQEQQHGDRAVTSQHAGERGESTNPSPGAGIAASLKAGWLLALSPQIHQMHPGLPGAKIQWKWVSRSFAGLTLSTWRTALPALSGHRKPQSQSCCGNCTGMDPLTRTADHRTPDCLGLEEILEFISPQPLPWTGTPATRPDCSKPHPTKMFLFNGPGLCLPTDKYLLADFGSEPSGHRRLQQMPHRRWDSLDAKARASSTLRMEQGHFSQGRCRTHFASTGQW